jgi:anti-sigma B factor antagonist
VHLARADLIWEVVLLIAPEIALVYWRDNADVVVEVSGELDILSAPQLYEGLAALIDGQGHLSIVIELSGLEFMDAAGLRVLVQAQHRIRSRGGEIRVARPRPRHRLRSLSSVTADDLASLNAKVACNRQSNQCSPTTSPRTGRPLDAGSPRSSS